VAYYENLLKKYGKGRERKTEIKQFEVIEARQVAIANTKLYVNREEGFIGTGLKKDELLFECSDLDDIIVFAKRGIMKVVKVSDKTFIGKEILYAAVFQKNDERTTYNMIYMDGKSKKSFAKRFNVTGVTRDKEYDLTKGDENSKIHYFKAWPNGEAEIVRIMLTPGSKAHKKELEFNFAELEIKGRSSMGNTVTKYPIKSDGVRLKEAGVSTIAGKKLWYDDQFGRLNTDEKGQYLGMFDGDDKILVVYNDGNYEVTDQELTQKLDSEKVIFIEKFNPGKIVTAIYADMKTKQFMAKRFKIETTTLKSKFLFIKEGEGNYVEAVTTAEEPVLAMQQGRGAQIRKGKLKITKIAEVTGYRTVGTKLADYSKSTEMEWVKSKESNQPELFG
jgi:topoisomerase IV subunit A